MESVEETAGLTIEFVVTRLRGMALYPHLPGIPLENIEPDRYDTFRRRVLGSETVPQACAQIVDGLPTAGVAWDRRIPGMVGDGHPIEEHPRIRPDAVEETSLFIRECSGGKTRPAAHGGQPSKRWVQGDIRQTLSAASGPGQGDRMRFTVAAADLRRRGLIRPRVR